LAKEKARQHEPAGLVFIAEAGPAWLASRYRLRFRRRSAPTVS